MAQSASESMMC
uniref:Uncharacterized protein n=1 Tax=Arundo donax TaxID=35708 RepID=A0A0A9BQB4_ARUDO